MDTSPTAPMTTSPVAGGTFTRPLWPNPPSATGSPCRIFSGWSCPACEMLHDLQTNKPQESDSDAMDTFLDNQSFLRRQINSLHDPFNKLPFELMREIFREVSLSPWTTAEDLVALVSVCRSWRNVILADAKFWSVLHIPFIADGRFGAKELKLWLSRSKKLPLSLMFWGTPQRPWRWCWPANNAGAFDRNNNNREAAYRATEDLQPVLEAEKHRILSVSAFNSTWFIKSMSKAPTIPNSTWPMLTSIDTTQSNGKFSLAEVLELFRQCPQVEYLNLAWIENGVMADRTEAHPISLPFLRNLCLGFTGLGYRPQNVLACLVTPALNAMTYRYSDGPGAESSSALEALFRRSACLLTTLHIQYGTFESDSLISLLKSQPSLRWLSTTLHPCRRQTEVEIQTSLDAFRDALRLLKKDRNEFLPNLEVLEHTGAMLYPWNDLVDVWMAYNALSDKMSPPATARRPLRMVRFLINGCVPYTNERQDQPTVFDDMVILNPLRWKHVRLLTAHASRGEANGGCRFECDCNISLLKAKY